MIMLCWQTLGSSTLPGDSVWTGVTMAGSLTAVLGTPSQCPGCSAGEVCSESGPCTVTKTKLASQNQPQCWELIVLEEGKW